MRIFYMGNGSDKLEKQAKKFGHEFVVGECVNPYSFDVFIVNERDSKWEYLWSQVPSKVWVSNPFRFEMAQNPLYQLGLAKSYFRTSQVQPKFAFDQRELLYDFPEGFEVTFLVMMDKVIPFRQTSFELSSNTSRKIRTYLKSLGVLYGFISFHVAYDTELLYFKEFTSIIHWDCVPTNLIDLFLYNTQLLTRSSRYRIN